MYQKEHFKILKRDEIVCEMAGAHYFSKLDASNGFWQVRLDAASTKFCTVNTPFGRSSFKRLPVGISSAPELFHKNMERVIEGLEGVCVCVWMIFWSGGPLFRNKMSGWKIICRGFRSMV